MVGLSFVRKEKSKVGKKLAIFQLKEIGTEGRKERKQKAKKRGLSRCLRGEQRVTERWFRVVKEKRGK